MIKSLLKDTAIYGLSDMILKVLAFFTFPIFAHLLSVSEYGVMQLITTISGIVAIFINLGINNAVSRYYYDPEMNEVGRPLLVSTGLYMLLISSLVVTFVASVLFFFVKDYLQVKFEVVWLVLVIGLASNIPTQLIQYANDTIRLHFSPLKFTILAFIKNLAAIFLSIWFLKNGKGLEGYFEALLIGPLVFIPLALFFIKKDLRLKWDTAVAKKLFRYGYPFIFASLGYWLFGSIDRWLLGVYSNSEEIGLYSIAFKFGTLILFISSAFGQAWSPLAIKMMKDAPNDYKTAFSSILTILYAVLCIIGIGVSLFSYEFLRFTTPQAYWPAANSVVFLSMALVINGTTQVTQLGISISEKTPLLYRAVWIATVVNMIFNFILIPPMGAEGASVSLLITYVFLTLLYLYYSQKVHPIPYNKKALSAITFVVFAVIGVSVLFNAFAWKPYFVALKAFFLVAALLFFLKAGIIKIAQIKTMFKRSNV